MKCNLREATGCYPRKGPDPQRKLLSGKLHQRLCGGNLHQPCTVSTTDVSSRPSHRKYFWQSTSFLLLWNNIIISYLPNSCQERDARPCTSPQCFTQSTHWSGEVSPVVPIPAGNWTHGRMLQWEYSQLECAARTKLNETEHSDTMCSRALLCSLGIITADTIQRQSQCLNISIYLTVTFPSYSNRHPSVICSHLAAQLMCEWIQNLSTFRPLNECMN